MEIHEYYKDKHVRARLYEFLGGNSLDSATSMFISECDPPSIRLGANLRLPSELDYFLDNGLDLSRSLWDKNSLIAHLDIEYVNFDYLAEPYLDPIRAFTIQKSSEWAIERLLLNNEIAPLHLLSGRGHHFAWRINRGSAAFGKLSQIGRLPRHLEMKYAVAHEPVNKPVDRDLGSAFAGLGLVMEYVAMKVREDAQEECPIPIELSAVEIPPQERGREMVSLDITEYGDLLNTRVIRIPFTIYLKPWRCDGILHDAIRGKVPPMIVIPLHELDVQEGLEVMRDFNAAADLATRASVQIPDQSKQMLDLIDVYKASDVAAFHDWFYSVEHELPELWNRTYDITPLDSIPPCTRYVLENPNDLLLKPAGIRQIVRIFLALGWHPRHIAGLIRSKFERDFGWGGEWYFYDAATRADFYTRIFSGMIVTRRDTLWDFDCEHTKKSGYCFNQQQLCRMSGFRHSLQERTTYERLARGPFNRFFLPD